MTACEHCGSTYEPPDTGQKMPVDTREWDFVCWTPGKLETARFVHRPEACRDVLHERLDVALNLLWQWRNRGFPMGGSAVWDATKRFLGSETP